MIRLAKWLVAVALMCSTVGAFGQGVGYSNTALAPTTSTNNSPARFESFATIRVCMEPASGSTCSPLANIYSDVALSVPLTNPFSADMYGNFLFYAAPGTYHIQVSGPGLTQYDIPSQNLGNGQGTVTLINTTYPLTGGPITANGTIACPTCATDISITAPPYNAIPDAVSDPMCSMDGSTANLTCTDAPFSVCPTGKYVSVNGALAGVAPTPAFPLSLQSSILSCSSSSVAVLATSSTHATGTVTAIWGTPNSAAVQAAVTAGAAVHSCVIFPPGNFLLDGSVATQIMVPGNSCIIQQPGDNLYTVGVAGYGLASANVAHDAYGDFRLVDGQDYFYFQFDGNIWGENTAQVFRYGIQTPNNVIKGYGNSGNSHVTITGTGWIQNQYGYQAAGYKGTVSGLGFDWQISNLNSNWVLGNYNVNTDHSTFQNLHNYNSAGVGEWAGATDVKILNNSCEHCSGTIYSIGGDVSGAACTNYIVSGNSATNTDPVSNEQMTIANCLTGAVISNNTLEVNGFNMIGITLTNSQIGAEPSYNQIIGNTILCFNGNVGIISIFANHNIIQDNVIKTSPTSTACGGGIGIFGEGGNTIQGNTIDALTGIMITNSTIPNKVANNTIGVSTVPYSINAASPLTPDSILAATSGPNNPAGIALPTGYGFNFLNPDGTFTQLATTNLGNWSNTYPLDTWVPTYFGGAYVTIPPTPPVSGGGIPTVVESHTLRIGPTGIGCTTSIGRCTTNSDNAGSNTLWLQHFDVPLAGTGGNALGNVTATGCPIYTDAVATGTVYCAIYDSDGAVVGTTHTAGTVLCSNVVGVAVNTFTTQTVSLAGCPTLVAGHANGYWIGVEFSNLLTVFGYYGVPGAARVWGSYPQTAGTFPANPTPQYQHPFITAFTFGLNVTTLGFNYTWGAGTTNTTTVNGVSCALGSSCTVNPFFTGTTGSIGGSLLASAGTCTSGTASVTGATVGHPVSVSASDGTLPNGLVVLSASVTSSNTVTVQLCAIASVTPAAKTYNVTTQ